MAASVWINEFNSGGTPGDTTDGSDFVEICGEAGTDLAGWKIYTYATSSSYNSYDISALTLSNQDQGFGFASLAANVNDGSGAIVLVDGAGNVVQVVGYGGSMTLVGGPADGTTTTDVAPGQVDYIAANATFQMKGTGKHAGDFTWEVAQYSKNALNVDQTLTNANDPPQLTGALSKEISEGEHAVLTSADLYYTDEDDSASGVTFTVSNLLNGAILVDGATAMTFTGADIDGGKVVFVHDGSETTTATFDVSVDDGNEDASPPTVSAFDFTVDPVNDPALISGDLIGVVHELLTTSVKGRVTASDVDSDQSFQVVTNAASDGGHGTFSVTSDGKWTYKLRGDDNAMDKLDSGDILKDHITVHTADGTAQQIEITIQGVTNINGTNGDDQGTFGQLSGTTAQDYIHGLKGDDLIRALSGDDYLFGDAGNDKLYGDAGNDVLDGGTGRDKLWGGSGADTFVFDDKDSGSAAKARDIIEDFSHKDGDLIDLSAIDANHGTAKDDAFRGYDGEKAALAHVGSLFIAIDGKEATLYLNTDAAKGFEMAIEVLANKFAPADFVF
jgi:VCBS repeat-containing protein